MLDGLRGGHEPGIQGWSLLKVLQDLLPFFYDAVDCRAGLSLCPLAEDLEHLLQALDLAFRLTSMLLKGSNHLFGFSSLRHLLQGGRILRSA